MKTLRILLLSIIALLPPGLLLAQTPDGFNPDASDIVYAITQQSIEGNILFAGSFTRVGGLGCAGLVRYNSAGIIDTSYEPNLVPWVQSIAVQPDGKVLTGSIVSSFGLGELNRPLRRLNSDGTPDTSLTIPVFDVMGRIRCIAVQPDGKIVVGGSFTSVSSGGDFTRNRIARLNSNGTVDSGFNPNANGNVNSIALQPDGKIVLGGEFTMVGGQTRNRIVRLNADGTLDTGFNPNANGVVFCASVQANGRILLGGNFSTVGGQPRNHIARVNADGTLDTGFNPDANGGVVSLALQADEKIVFGGGFTTVGGQVRNRIARLNADGALDSSFNPDANAGVNSIALQADGKVLMGGSFTSVGEQQRNRIARLNNDPATQTLTVTGTSQIDWQRGGSAPEVEKVTFERWNGSDWVSLGAATRVAGGWRRTGLSLPASGWIRARGHTCGGYFNASSGILGQSVSYGGPSSPDIAVAVAGAGELAFGSSVIDFGSAQWPAAFESTKTIVISNVGNASLTGLNIALAGANPGDFSVSSLGSSTVSPGGSVSFDVTLSAKASGASGAVLRISSNDPDEALFEIVLARYYVHAETSFDPDASGNVRCISLQPDGGSIIGGAFTTMAGQTRNRIARLNADGSLDSSFNPNANQEVYSMAVQHDQKILIAGAFSNVGGLSRNGLARLNVDGTVDAGFNPNPNSSVFGIALQTDGKILLGGFFSSVGGTTRNRIARLNADGSLDSSFNPNASGSRVNCISVQADGRILAGGSFWAMGGVSRDNVARLNADGTVDGTFFPNADGEVFALAIQPDGKILMCGSFTTVGGIARNRIARLNANGSLDVSFNPNADNTVSSLVLQADGKILLGGFFTTIGGQSRYRIARLNADGTLDAGFNPGVNTSILGFVSVDALAVSSDEGIVLGGGFSTVAGLSRNRIARIFNSPRISSLNVGSITQIDWTRGGSAPEVEQVIFERWNGSEWISLGAASRVTEGWRLTGLSLPLSGQIRARGRATGGQYNGGSSLIEQQAAYSFLPEIAVSGNGVDIANGDDTPDPADHTDFGQVSPSGGSLARVFTITNSGSGELNLSGTPRVDLSDSVAFSVTQQPASATVAAGGGTQTFEVTFAPTTPGTHSATISIANDDPNEHPFTFTLTGTGNTAPTFAGYSVATAWQTAASISLGKLLAKAADAEGHALSVTAAGPASAQGGTAVLQSGSILYTPPASFSGNDTFSVTIADPYGATVSGTVTVSVAPNPTSGGVGVNPPQITMLGNGDASVASQGIPGRTYMVQRSTDLSYWATIGTVVAASNGVVTFVDENPPPGSAFYRLGRNVPVMNFWGDGSDGSMITSGNVSLANVQDGDVVVKQYTDLTINAGHTLTTQTRCRGLVIYVNGDCTINGTLSMTARGANVNPALADSIPATGIRLARFKFGSNETLSVSDLGGTGLGGVGGAWRAAESQQLGIAGNGRIYTIAREGGAGAIGVSMGLGTFAGADGLTAANGTGGGGAGGVTNRGTGGDGGWGTCFSGGSGGGGSANSFVYAKGGNGSSIGGAGGTAIEGAGGGAGNPGGVGSGYGTNGENGTGGLLILLVRGTLTVGPSGAIRSDGSAGGNVNGGGSGGGRVVILHAGSAAIDGAVTAQGMRIYADTSIGGAGAITIEQIDP